MGLGDTERIAKILVDPDEDRHRLRLRAGQALERQRRPRRLPDDRRRQDVDEGPEGRQPLDRLLDDLHGPAESEHALCRHVGLPPQGLDVPLGRRQRRRRRAERPVQVDRRRRDVDGSRREEREGPSVQALGPRRGLGGAGKPNVVYAFIEAAIPKNGLYRSDDGGATWQALDRSQIMVWRPFYFANLIVDPEGREQALQAGPDAHRLDRRRQELLRHRRRRARRLPRRLDRSRQHRSPHRRRRRGRLVFLRRRQHVVEGGEPADLAVLPRERRHGHAVQRLRRPAGQQLLGRRLRVPGRHHQRAVGKHVRRRRLLDVRRPVRSDVHLRRVAGRQHRPRQPQDARDRATSSRCPATRKASCATTGTRRSISPRRRRAPSTSARSSSSARAITARRGSASRPTSPRTIPKNRSRSSPAASRSTTPRPRCTRRSTRSPSRRRTRTSSGSAPTTATCRSPRDGGKTWKNVVGNVPGLPKNAWVSSIEAGHFDDGTAYATFDLHTFGDMRPYVYRTTDFGKTWTALVARGRLDEGLRPRRQGRPRQQEPALRRHGDRPLDLARRRQAVGAVQGRRDAERRRARPRDPPARRTISSSPRTGAASGSSTTSRRCAR